MLSVEDLHPKAMDLAESAFLARREGKLEEAKTLFQKALALEQQAAAILPPDENSEPTRSILYRSAAALAYHAEQYDIANELITAGFSGFPPPEIKQELETLSKEVKFQCYLNSVKTKGVPIHLKGILKYADSTEDSQLGVIKVVEPDTNQKHSIFVPIALMKHIVCPYYEENVIITAFLDGKDIYLGEITLNQA